MNRRKAKKLTDGVSRRRKSNRKAADTQPLRGSSPDVLYRDIRKLAGFLGELRFHCSLSVLSDGKAVDSVEEQAGGDYSAPRMIKANLDSLEQHSQNLFAAIRDNASGESLAVATAHARTFLLDEVFRQRPKMSYIYPIREKLQVAISEGLLPLVSVADLQSRLHDMIKTFHVTHKAIILFVDMHQSTIVKKDLGEELYKIVSDSIHDRFIGLCQRTSHSFRPTRGTGAGDLNVVVFLTEPTEWPSLAIDVAEFLLGLPPSLEVLVPARSRKITCSAAMAYGTIVLAEDDILYSPGLGPDRGARFLKCARPSQLVVDVALPSAHPPPFDLPRAETYTDHNNLNWRFHRLSRRRLASLVQ